LTDSDDDSDHDGGTGAEADRVHDLAAPPGKRSCKGYRPLLQDEHGGMLNFTEVYPWARHGSGDTIVAGFTATSCGVIHSNACTGTVEEEGLDACCRACSRLEFKPQLKNMLDAACLDYEGSTLYVNNRYLNHRQLCQKNEMNRLIQQELRLSNMNLAKKTVRVSRQLETWKKIYLLLAKQDVLGIRCVRCAP
jgi:hypothetical protein